MEDHNCYGSAEETFGAIDVEVAGPEGSPEEVGVVLLVPHIEGVACGADDGESEDKDQAREGDLSETEVCRVHHDSGRYCERKTWLSCVSALEYVQRT